MSDSLTTLIGKVQALLLDGGTSYSTATCTAALRQALKEFNDVAPIHAGTLIDVVSGQYEYELDTSDFTGLLEISHVKLKDPTGGENDTPLDYDEYFLDNRPYIKLRQAQTSGQLDIGYTLPQTINGLDSETESTIPTQFNQTIVNGGAYYAICIRSAGRVETINLNTDVPDNLREAAGTHLLAFRLGLLEAGKRKAPPHKTDPTWSFNPRGY